MTGFLAVIGARTSELGVQALVVPATFLVVALALHVFLVAVGFRGDQLLLPLALGLTAIGLVAVQRLAPSVLLVQQLTWTIVAAGLTGAAVAWWRHDAEASA